MDDVPPWLAESFLINCKISGSNNAHAYVAVSRALLFFLIGVPRLEEDRRTTHAEVL
jgi:hypothetical protein